MWERSRRPAAGSCRGRAAASAARVGSRRAHTPSGCAAARRHQVICRGAAPSRRSRAPCRRRRPSASLIRTRSPRGPPRSRSAGVAGSDWIQASSGAGATRLCRPRASSVLVFGLRSRPLVTVVVARGLLGPLYMRRMFLQRTLRPRLARVHQIVPLSSWVANSGYSGCGARWISPLR